MLLRFADINPVVLHFNKKDFAGLDNCLHENKTAFYFSEKTQSIDLLSYLTAISPGAVLYITSYSVSERLLNFLHLLKEKGIVEKLYILIDWKIKLSRPDLANYAESVADGFKVCNIHGKIWLLDNGKIQISHISSTNLNYNPREESGVITCDNSIFEFYKKILDERLFN
jgi:hypothetical protein